MEKYITETCEGYSLVDNITGELREVKLAKKLTIDEFIVLFLRSIPELMELKGKQLKLLLICLKKCTFNKYDTTEGNVLYVNKLFYDTVRDCGLQLSDNAIRMYIHYLADNNFLIRRCKGCYMLNPKYFFKGRITDATKMQMTLKSNC